MNLLVRAVLRQLWVQRGMTISMMCGIALASLSIVAVHVIADVVRNGFEGDGPGAGFGFTHLLHRPGLDEEAYLALRSQWRAGGLPGVAALVPLIEGRAVGRVDDRPRSVKVLGLDGLALPAGTVAGPTGTGPTGMIGRAFLAGASGRLRGPEGAVGLTGETIQFSTPTGFREVVVESSAGSIPGPGEPLLVVDIGVAQEILHRPGDLSRIGAVWRDPQAPDAGWSARLFPGFAARGWVSENAWAPEGFRAEAVRDRGERLFAAAILFNLSVLSVLSAVVAAFLIHQGAVNSISHRAMLFDRLKAMGVTQRWLALHVTLEGLIVAVFGAVLGCGSGLLVANGLIEAVLGDSAALDPGAAVWACAKATVLSAVVAAVGMCLALSTGTSGPRGRAGVTLTVVGAAVVAGAAASATGGSGLIGVFVLIAALALLAALAAGRTLGLWNPSKPAGIATGSLVGTMNRRSLSLSRAEVSVSLGGLVIALIAAYGLSLMVSNFRLAFEAMLDQRLDAHVYLDATEAFSRADIQQIAAAAGPGATPRFERRSNALVPGSDGPVRVQVIHDAGAGEYARYGFAGALGDTSTLINEPSSARLGRNVGDEVVLETERGSVRLIVAGVFRDYGAATGRLVVGPAIGEVLFGETPSRSVGLAVADPSAADTLRGLADVRNWRYRSAEDIRTVAVDVFDRTFRLSDGLVMIAVAIAVVGLFNALIALRIRRQREFHLLKVMGFSSAEFLRMNLGYGAMLGIHAVVVALPVGVGVGWLLCEVLNPRSFGWSVPFAIDPNALVGPAVIGVLGAMLSALVPGMRMRGGRVDAS